MSNWTRRELVKNGILAGAAVLTPNIVHALGNDGTSDPVDEVSTERESLVAPSPRDRLRLDDGWRFQLGHAVDPSFGYLPSGASAGGYAKGGMLFSPSSSRFDASAWHEVNVPHDWAIELPFVADPRLSDYGFKPVHRDYPDTSIGWYRKVFTLPASDAGRRLSIEFDGVFRDATVALNGHLLGRNLSGYAPFRFDITDVATLGGDNVLVVRVDATEHEGWFYEGAGIYRHVWLVKTAPVHVPQWGTYVTSEVAGRGASLRLLTEIANESDVPAQVRVVSNVLDAAGKSVARSVSDGVRVEPWGTVEQRQQVSIGEVALWSPESPTLYSVVTTIEANGAVIDQYETTFGVRTIRFDASEGFFLNGKRVEVKGTCNHQDHAGVGAALPDRLQYFRIDRLKAMGSNAYRTAHNPPTPELLDACDSLGMMVVDETRAFGTSTEALSQLERMLRRDRNHPSIIAWSILNEEPTQGNERGAKIAAVMSRMVRRLDPTRPITAGMDNGWGMRGATSQIDIQGFNYRAPQTDAFHQANPTIPVWGTETASCVSTRGIYTNDAAKGYLSAYDRNFPWWASTSEAWYTLFNARKWISGGFIWTGFDYRGEPTPYLWPCISSHFGVIDTCGYAKDNFYYYLARWSEAPVLHLFPHWSWAGKEGQEIEVWCHTNLDSVELFLNGQSVGKRDVPRNSHAEWKVPYAPGKIEARGMRDGKVVLTRTNETTGSPVRIALSADRSTIAGDGEDVAVVTATVVDAGGRMVPIASDEITYQVSGAGRLLGVGNGDPSSHESDKGPARRAFNGLSMALVQASKAGGVIRVGASSAQLGSATLEITCRPTAAKPSV